MSKASPFVCLVIDAGLSSGTSVGSVGWSLPMPSLCDLDFLKAWWTLRASIPKRARPKLYHLALQVIQNPFAWSEACPDLREETVDSPPTSSGQNISLTFQKNIRIKNLVAAILEKYNLLQADR